MARRPSKRSSKLLHRITDASGLFTPAFLEWVERAGDAVVLESARYDPGEKDSYVFLKPEDRIVAPSLESVERRLADVQQAVDDGYWVAGYISYEAGYAFEKVLPRPAAVWHPYLWFGVYEAPIVWNRIRRTFTGGTATARNIARELVEEEWAIRFPPIDPRPMMDAPAYADALQRIQGYILAGDTYQVNYTFKLKFPWREAAAPLYVQLREEQRVRYSAFIAHRNARILSFSPELFFRLDGSRITLRPMKGTAPRGRTLEEDKQRRTALTASEKDRAENLMIVDLLRNDVGKIATTGSVKVVRFFEIEALETVFQATTTIEARIGKDVGPYAMIRSLFPSGSVTGAPKIRTMQIIHELEREARGVYTGVIGFFVPKRKAVFSVAIRTVAIDRKTKTAELGIGSGVVSDSKIDDEYRECLLKGSFLTRWHGAFRLIETFRWEPGRSWFLRSYHLKRLQRSAEYFGFEFKKKRVESYLAKLNKSLKRLSRGTLAFRVRLTMSRAGELHATYSPLDALKGEQVVKVSEARIDSSDRFLYHKTTNRQFYDRELERAMLAGYIDVLFLNERDEVAEGARSNVIVRKGGQYITPPLTSGVLPGTYREFLLKSRKRRLREEVLTLDDLRLADEVFICNAVRGLVRVKVEFPISPKNKNVPSQEVEHAPLLVGED